MPHPIVRAVDVDYAQVDLMRRARLSQHPVEFFRSDVLTDGDAIVCLCVCSQLRMPERFALHEDGAPAPLDELRGIR